jgi:RNA polymerase sigma factor (TIGR02999 family)
MAILLSASSATDSGATCSEMSESEPLQPPSDDDLYRRAYQELKRMASHHLRAMGSGGSTLSTTELVHEAYLRLQATSPDDWDGRAHFFGAAARAMRQVLVDFARRRGAAKRGGDATRVSLSDGDLVLEVQLDEILALDEALGRLGTVDERLRQIVDLRFFGGFSEQEVADLLGVARRTIERSWMKARLFLLRELEPKAAAHARYSSSEPTT